jgi:hypothetical protein
MKFEHAVFYSAILERLLREYKFYVFSEAEKQEIEKFDYAIRKSINKKQRKELIKNKKTYLEKSTEQLNRIEKYNSEVSKNFVKNNNELEPFMNEVQDFFNDFICLLFDNTNEVSKTNPKNFIVALLEESGNGNLFLKGKRWKIHTK